MHLEFGKDRSNLGSIESIACRSREQWTRYEEGHTGDFSSQTISVLDKVERVTIGPKDITLKVGFAFTTQSWQHLTFCTINFRGGIDWLGAWCHKTWGGELWFATRLSAVPLPGWRYWFRNGQLAHPKIKGWVSRQANFLFLGGSITKSIRHCGGALQHHTLHSSADWVHWHDILHRQWGPLQYLPEKPGPPNANIWRFEPLGLTNNVWHHHMLSVPRAAKCRFEEAGYKHGALSPPTLFPAGI